jgi:hypothetical protein
MFFLSFFFLSLEFNLNKKLILKELQHEKSILNIVSNFE